MCGARVVHLRRMRRCLFVHKSVRTAQDGFQSGALSNDSARMTYIRIRVHFF
jgi:hypothetical protein